jgi:hypothetical protein
MPCDGEALAVKGFVAADAPLLDLMFYWIAPLLLAAFAPRAGRDEPAMVLMSISIGVGFGFSDGVSGLREKKGNHIGRMWGGGEGERGIKGGDYVL